jgi:succinyl-CoA synthetase beta subunit
MKLHEYQAKEIFRKWGIPTPEGAVAFSGIEAMQIAKGLNTDKYVVKAQIHAGGRGKAGGVKLVDSPDEVKAAAEELIGKRLVTHQTGPEGKEVHQVLVETASSVKQELYVGILVDRNLNRPAIMTSAEGGMEIEEVARQFPEKIFKEWVDPLVGFRSFQGTKLGFKLGFDVKLSRKLTAFLSKLVKLFEGVDASLCEINPMILTDEDEFLALDAKLTLDDNGLARHSDLAELRDTTEEDPLEVEASKHNLNYIKLDGNIGCMVNGAGLAMATMDMIKLSGAEPANFLDVGGGASAEMVENAFRILMSDKNVKAVLINIFGGILRCDTLATGVVEATKKVNVNRPIIIRLEGTNVEEGRRILNESGLDFQVAEGMKDASEKIVSIVKSFN